MLPDFAGKACQRRFPAAALPEQPQRFVTGHTLKHSGDALPVQPRRSGVGRQNFHPAVAVLGVGVSHASGHLHQLADVADEQGSPEFQFPADSQGCLDIIGALHRQGGVNAQLLPDEVRAIVTRSQQHEVCPVSPALGQLHPDGVHQGFLAHGLHNAGGAQNGDAPHNAQPWVEGLLRQPLPLGYGDFYPQPAVVIRQSHDLSHILPDHLPGHGVDGRLPHGLIQTGLGHPTNASTAVNRDAGALLPEHPGIDQGSVGHIRVVPAVLADGTGHLGLLPMDILHFQLQFHALGGQQGNLPLFRSRQQHPGRRLGSRRSTGAGGVAQPQPLSVFFDVRFHSFSAESDTAGRCRWPPPRCCRPSVPGPQCKVRPGAESFPCSPPRSQSPPAPR